MSNETCPNCNGKMVNENPIAYHGYRCADCAMWISYSDLRKVKEQAKKTMAAAGRKKTPQQMPIDFEALAKLLTKGPANLGNVKVVKIDSLSALVEGLDAIFSSEEVAAVETAVDRLKAAHAGIGEDLKKNKDLIHKCIPVTDGESRAAYRLRLIAEHRLFKHCKGSEYYVTDYGFRVPSQYGEQPVATEIEYKSLITGETFRQSFKRFYGNHSSGIARFTLVTTAQAEAEARIEQLNDEIRNRRNEVKRLRYAIRTGSVNK